MKVLVTGGAGFVGSHLVEALVKQGDEVTILDDFSGGVIENLFGHTVIKGSITSPEIVASACKGQDLIYHLAALINVDESIAFPELFHHVNAGGTLNVLKSAKCPIIHMSTSECYGSAMRTPMDEEHPLVPASPYAASKVAAEMYCTSFHQTYNTEVAVVRAFNQYGPRQKGNLDFGGIIARNIIRIISGKRPVVRGGAQRRDYLYCKDTVEGLMSVAKKGTWGKIINLGSGYSVSISKIVSMLLDLCDSDLKPVMEPSRPGDVLDLVCDSGRAALLLGWGPTTSFENGLTQTIEWYRANQERSKRYIFPSFQEQLSYKPYTTIAEAGYEIIRRREGQPQAYPPPDSNQTY